ncbi:glycosyltransferase family 2 protein [Methylotetracoccus oryzae]|uniref:glycosyltransferase family 2 protein n=1 Tax=Methylotetracoccus oryzae TaxID=1919059 RepID=UPI001119A06D|nr:glycosyltransferase family 2 protein [Methylotetracoccus oryzae]
MSAPNIVVILSAYNEAQTIADTIAAFAKALREAALYVINNNSSDKTPELASEALLRPGHIGGVTDEPRQGKGNALRRTFHEIDADIYLIADADMTYPADRERDLIAPVVEGVADMVVGDRHTGGHYAYSRLTPIILAVDLNVGSFWHTYLFIRDERLGVVVVSASARFHRRCQKVFGCDQPYR